MAIRDFRVANLRPLPKVMDLRSANGSLPTQSSRISLNLLSCEDGNLRRLGGWQRLGKNDTGGFNNQDLHDQLLSSYTLTPAPSDPTPTHPADTQVHQEVTLLKEVINADGDRRILAGTRSRLYASTGDSGNWRIILDDVGRGDQSDTSIRFRAATLGNVSIIVNGQDLIYYWVFEDDFSHTAEGSCYPVSDLQELDITSARHVAEYRGFMFIAGTVEGGVEHPGKIYWSDYNNPRRWFALPDSAAGFMDLGGGERVLGMLPIGEQLRIYTNRAIYQVNLVGGDVVFSFNEIYSGPHVPAFENSIVDVGASHFYFSEESIVRLGQYDRTPNITGWVHNASGAVFQGIRSGDLADLPASLGVSAIEPLNRTKCHLPVAGYDQQRKNVWFSWPAGAATGNSHSLVLNLRENSSCLVDHGFSAFASFALDDRQSVRSWLAAKGICDVGPEPNEGNPSPLTFTPTTAVSIRNAVEDPETPEDADSLCNLIGSEYLDCQQCGSDFGFVMADTADNVLKEFTEDGFAREVLTAPVTPLAWDDSGYDGTNDTKRSHPIAAGAYQLNGFVSLLQLDPDTLGERGEKHFRRVTVQFDSVDHATPAYLFCQIGYGQTPGHMQWSETPKQPIDRLTTESNTAHTQNNTRAAEPADFNFMRRGLLFAARLIIADENLAPVQGGDASFNRFVLRWSIASR